MAGELIGALRVTLGLDTAQFEAGSKKARGQAKSTASAIQAEFSKLKGLGASLAGIWASSELVAAGKRALDYASSLGEVAQQLGVTTKDLQTFRYAASQAGISNDEMDKSLAKLTRTIGEAKAGSKAQATTFRELGVAVQDVNGRVYTAGELMPKLADAIAKIKDPATRARIEVELFGKAGQKLDTLLAGGSQAINELTNAAQKLGIVLSDEQIQKADETADKLAAVKQVLEARIAGVVADNADAIMSLANAFEYLIGKAGGAVQAYMRFKAQAGIRFEEGRANGWFTSEADKKDAKKNIRRYQDMLVANGGTVDDPEYLRQKSLSDARKLLGYQPPKAPPQDGALPTVASSGGRTRKSRGPSGPTAAEIEEKHQQELSRIRQEQLQAELDLTNDAEERADIQSQLLTEEFNERRAQVENDEHFTKAQKKAQVELLKKLYGVSGEGDDIVVGAGASSLATGISRERSERLAREAYDLQVAEITGQQEMLQGQLNMARTAEERRRLSLELLDLEYKLKEAKLDQILSSQESSQAEKDIAQLAKDRLAGQKAQDTANINRSNMGPMASYLDSLPQSVAELNEALEQVAVRGIQSVEDGLMSIIDGTKSVGAAFRDMASSIISDLLRIAIQQSITMPLANMLGLGGGLGGSVGNMMGPSVSGGGGLFGQLLGLGGMFLGSVRGGGLGGVNSTALGGLEAGLHSATLNNMGSFMMPLPGMANGGTIGGFPGTDKNILSINGIPRVRVSANERIRVEPNGENWATRAREKAIHIGSMHFPNVTNGREAREAARQAASELRKHIADSSKRGY